MKQAEGRFRQAKDALAAISKDDEGRRMLVPLTQSLYVPGELGDPDLLLVELGGRATCPALRHAAAAFNLGAVNW